jgi:hypothetical protein
MQAARQTPPAKSLQHEMHGSPIGQLFYFLLLTQLE